MIARSKRDDSLCAAALSGRLSADARAAHVSTCEHCLRASLQAAVAGRVPAGPPRFVDPTVVWAHARELRRIEAEARITRLLTAVQIAIGIVILVPIALFTGLPTALPTFEVIRQWPWALIGSALGFIAVAGTGFALLSQDA